MYHQYNPKNVKYIQTMEQMGALYLGGHGKALILEWSSPLRDVELKIKTPRGILDTQKLSKSQWTALMDCCVENYPHFYKGNIPDSVKQMWGKLFLDDSGKLLERTPSHVEIQSIRKLFREANDIKSCRIS